MEQIKNTIKKLCSTVGVAGLESKASETAAELLRDYTNGIYDCRIDHFGNVTALIKSDNPNAKTLMLDAHIDEIGMIVIAIDDKGFLKAAGCGGVDNRLLSAQEVTVHCEGGDILGVIGAKPPHLQKADDAKKIGDMEDMFIDIGMSKEQAEKKVKLGDRVTIRSVYRELINNRVSVKALDDRAGVAAILEAVRLLQNERLNVNLAVLFSAQEEVSGAGARVASYGLSPDYAIAVDVSFAHTADADEHKCGKMGGGVMIGVSALLDKNMSDDLTRLAKEKEIKHQIEVITGRSTGTNADHIICTKSGVRTAVLSIPLKYMHTPIEVVELSDIQSAAQLIAQYALSL